MKTNSYAFQFVVFLVWIFVVGAIFSFVSIKQVAGVITGIGFIGIPLYFLIKEIQKPNKFLFHIVSLSIFLLASALPIFLLRVTNWNVEFKDLSLMGISSEVLHRSSNVFYIIMMFSVVLCWYLQRKHEQK